MARPRSEDSRNIVFKLRMSDKEYGDLFKFSKNRNQPKTKTIREALERYYAEEQDNVVNNDDQPLLPGIDIHQNNDEILGSLMDSENGKGTFGLIKDSESDNDTTYEFLLFMDSTGRRKGAIRIMNALVRNGISSKKIFAETDPLDFIKFKGIGPISMPYILEKQAEARKMFGLDPFPEPGCTKIAEKLKEKVKVTRIENRERWMNWWEQYYKKCSAERISE